MSTPITDITGFHEATSLSRLAQIIELEAQLEKYKAVAEVATELVEQPHVDPAETLERLVGALVDLGLITNEPVGQ